MFCELNRFKYFLSLVLCCFCIKNLKVDIFILSRIEFIIQHEISTSSYQMFSPVANIHSQYFVYWTGIINTIKVPQFRGLQGETKCNIEGHDRGLFFHSQRNYRTQCYPTLFSLLGEQRLRCALTLAIKIGWRKESYEKEKEREREKEHRQSMKFPLRRSCSAL